MILFSDFIEKQDHHWEAAEQLQRQNNYPYEMMPLLYAITKSSKANLVEAQKLINEGKGKFEKNKPHSSYDQQIEHEAHKEDLGDKTHQENSECSSSKGNETALDLSKKEPRYKIQNTKLIWSPWPRSPVIPLSEQVANSLLLLTSQKNERKAHSPVALESEQILSSSEINLHSFIVSPLREDPLMNFRDMLRPRRTP